MVTRTKNLLYNTEGPTSPLDAEAKKKVVKQSRGWRLATMCKHFSRAGGLLEWVVDFTGQGWSQQYRGGPCNLAMLLARWGWSTQWGGGLRNLGCGTTKIVVELNRRRWSRKGENGITKVGGGTSQAGVESGDRRWRCKGGHGLRKLGHEA